MATVDIDTRVGPDAAVAEVLEKGLRLAGASLARVAFRGAAEAEGVNR